jgi:hypothetical protein
MPTAVSLSRHCHGAEISNLTEMTSNNGSSEPGHSSCLCQIPPCSGGAGHTVTDSPTVIDLTLSPASRLGKSVPACRQSGTVTGGTRTRRTGGPAGAAVPAAALGWPRPDFGATGRAGRTH